MIPAPRVFSFVTVHQTIATQGGVMFRNIAFSIFVIFTALAGSAAWAQELTLTRLECGTGGPRAVNERFSDTYAYGDRKIDFVFSCYLIKRGDEYMLWDTGYAMNAPGGVAAKVSVVDQLKQLNV